MHDAVKRWDTTRPFSANLNQIGTPELSNETFQYLGSLLDVEGFSHSNSTPPTFPSLPRSLSPVATELPSPTLGIAPRKMQHLGCAIPPVLDSPATVSFVCLLPTIPPPS